MGSDLPSWVVGEVARRAMDQNTMAMLGVMQQTPRDFDE